VNKKICPENQIGYINVISKQQACIIWTSFTLNQANTRAITKNKFEHEFLKTRFLLKYSIIQHDSKFIVTRAVKSTQCIAWFWEKMDSKSYLFLKTKMKQCCFGDSSSKQLLHQLPNDEWWRGFGSGKLGLALINFCHVWSLKKTVEQMAFQLVCDGWNELKMVSRCCIKQGTVEFLKFVDRFLKMEGDEKLREWGFLWC
jgi:hypothetical protein